MKRAILNKLFLLAVPSVGFFISSSQTWAGTTLTTTRSTCNTLDCGGTSLTANYIYEEPFTQAIPFSVQLFSAGNECLRVSVTSQNIDSGAALISPSNQVWVNDDFNGSLNPRIVARTTVKGWYTLQLTKYNGVGPGGQITFKYGRYSSSNVNCSNPTSPTNTAQATQRKVVEPIVLPQDSF